MPNPRASQPPQGREYPPIPEYLSGEEREHHDNAAAIQSMVNNWTRTYEGACFLVGILRAVDGYQRHITR